LRRWDDLAKDANRATPALTHYMDIVTRVAH
jgi:predicted HD phosphohydrolase